MSDQKPDTKMVSVQSFKAHLDAEMVRGKLASHGIVSYIHTDHVVGVNSSLPTGFIPSIHLMVREADLKMAQMLLKIQA